MPSLVRSMLRSILCPLAALVVSSFTATSAQVPSGFVDEAYLTGWTGPVGFTHDAVDRMYVWERGGRVFIVENGVRLAQPLIDIHDEVGSWRDFGLLGFALDPDFLVNGHFYLYYVVDRHHLRFAGTPQYNPNTNEYFAATIGRVTRYSADPQSNFTSTLPGSRTVLLGQTASSGVPILHESHGTGALLFGEDGTLLLSSGDGASYNGVDQGSRADTYWQAGLADGIIRPSENVGAFRSQMIDSYSGKILRLDPATGAGVASNPYFDPAAPFSARSRVYALGLRNPFRFTLQPGTGDPNPSAGRPGTLFVGDVCWYTWEELNIVTEPGMNFGWPLFEGMITHPDYIGALVQNRDTPNPLAGQGGCGVPYFRFQDLLKQEQLDHSPSFPNPCNTSLQIAPGTPTFMHHRPELGFRHGNAPETHVPTFTGNAATYAALGSPGTHVAGSPFNGNCSVAGCFHSGVGLGPVYNGSYFHLDFSLQWIRALRFDGKGHHLEEVLPFATVASPVFLGESPSDGALLYVTLSGNSIRRIRYTGSANVAPIARVSADQTFGPSPLDVQFDGTGSYDPEGGLIEFDWDYDDGATSTRPSPARTMTAPSSAPFRRDVQLTVTDAQGATSARVFPVHLNNSPPVVAITSFTNGARYSTASSTILPLQASVSDAEHSPASLSYSWQVYLHHDNHEHPEEPLTTPVASATLTPTPCSGEFFAYRVVLRVSDPLGLTGEAEAWLFPDCATSTVTAQITGPDVGAPILPNELVTLQATATGPLQRVDFFVDDRRVGTRFAPPWEASYRPTTFGTYVATAVAIGVDGSSSSSIGRELVVRQPSRIVAAIASGADDVEENEAGRVSSSSSDLEFGMDGSRLQVVGMRFSVPVPRGVMVTDAWLQFTADEVDEGPGLFTIRAERADDAAPFTSGGYNLSSRPRTLASVSWSPPAWRYVRAIGAAQRTPSLAPILQELVQRPGWNAGQSMLFVIEGFGERTAEAYDGNDELRPRLVVEYGATGSNEPPMVEAGEPVFAALGSPALLQGSVFDDGLPSGTLTSVWSLVSGPGAVTFQDPAAPETTATFGAAGSYVLRLSASDGEFTRFDDVAATVLASVQTYEVRLAGGDEDAEERVSGGAVSLDSTDLELVTDGSRVQIVGARFPVAVPRGATIVDAWIQFTVDEANSGATTLIVDAEASDDAGPIVGTTGNLSGRLRTGLEVTFDVPPWTQVGAAGPDQRAANLAPLVQAVIDREGWQSGNSMLFLIRGAGERTAESYNGSASRAPLLHIEYQ